jgi:sugar-specific transcriptional regulator TrmB
MVKLKRIENTIKPLVSDLQDLGFSKYEAEIYITLLKNFPSTAYEISKLANLPRSNTYAALDSLTKKMAVQPVSQNPIQYAPIKPEILFNQISDETSLKCEKLLTNLESIQPQESSEFVWTIEGKERVYKKIREMINNAEQHIWIKAHESILIYFKEILKDAEARGISILIILFGETPRDFYLGKNTKVYLHEANGIRIGNADNMLTITSDFKLALTASLDEKILATYTTNTSFVTMAECLIRHDVYMSEIFEKFSNELEAEFGPFLSSLRKKYFTPDQLIKYNENIKKIVPNNII